MLILKCIAVIAGVSSLLGLSVGSRTDPCWVLEPALTCPAWTVEGNQDEGEFGNSVASAGDVNGDGYDDVIVGAMWYDHGFTDEGRAYVYMGSASGLSTSPAWTADPGEPAANFGVSVASAGDVNGDGFDDVIVGAFNFQNGQPHEGAAFVYLGSSTGLATSPAWTVEGDQLEANFGGSVASAGDVNGDGYDDVLVGARLFDNGELDEGQAFLYLGSPTGPSTSPAWTADGDQPDAYFGVSVAGAGDVNGDGFSDVLVGAYNYDNGQSDEGRAFLYLGSASGLATSPAWTAESDQASAHFGSSVATAGDVNGDGYDDVLVGAFRFSNGQTNEGRAYAYLGSAAGLASSPAWTVESDQATALLGKVASAGDVNGDGYDDVLVGAEQFSNGQLDEGRAQVYLGSPAGLSTSQIWSAESDQAFASFGSAAATAGDVNGDGYSDVIIGARGFDDGQPDEGRAYLYMGSAGFLSSAVYPGDGINADTITPENAALGSTWSAPLTVGHAHGVGGPLSLKVRGATINGPNFPSPNGGRLTEFLVGGPLLAAFAGSHNGVSGDIPPQLIPNQISLIGVTWAAQYTVAGGGFADLSQAVYGVIDCP